MQKDRYAVSSDSEREKYEFLSCGPKGIIKKVVRYRAIGQGIYNLSFGDLDEETQSVRDGARTNNGDRNKVLATVVFTVFEFMKFHPESIIVAMGSTPARTRLYQMGIADNLTEIRLMFDIEGYYNGDWESFRKGKNYQAFSLKVK